MSAMAPVDGTAKQGDPLAGHFVDDHEARVVPAALARGNGGGGNADRDGNHNAAKKNEKQSCGRRMETPGDRRPIEAQRPPIPMCRGRACPDRRRRKWRRSRPRASCGRRRVAQERPCGGSVAALFILRPFVPAAGQLAEIFEHFGIEHGRADLVNAHGPLAEIDLAAAIRAEGKVFVLGLNNHAAGGAMEKLGGFFLCGSHVPMSYYRAVWQAGAPRPQCRWPRSWERRQTGDHVASRSRSTGTFSAWPSGQFGCGSMSSMM